MKGKDRAYWLADKIPAYGDYAKEAALVLCQQADEIERLRGLLGEPLRVIAVEAIREATGCPDLIGRDSVKLTEKLLKKAAELLVPNAEVTSRPPTGD